MKSLKVIIFVAVLLVGMSQNSYAGIKFDFGATAGKVTETVSGWLEVAKKKMDESVTLQTIIAYGKGAAESAKILKQMKSNIEADINSVKDTALNSVGEITGDVAGDINDATGKVNSATNNPQAQSAAKLMSLKEEKATVEADQEKALADAQAAYDAKIKLVDDNINKLRAIIASDPSQSAQYQAQIATYEKQKSNYKNELDTKQDGIRKSNQSKIDALDEEMSELRSKTAEAAGKAAADKLKSLTGEDDGAAEMNATIAKIFLKEDQAESSENIVPLAARRNYIAQQDTVKAFNTSLVVKKTRVKDSDSADETADAVTNMDGASAAIGMDTKLKIENMKSILKYNDLLLQDMKQKTANALASSSKYKLRDYSKDVTEFNLDDYVFDKKSLKKKLADLAKILKTGDISGAAGGIVADLGASSDSGGSGGAETGKSVYEELRRARAASGNYDGMDSSGPTDEEPVSVTDELEQARSAKGGENK